VYEHTKFDELYHENTIILNSMLHIFKALSDRKILSEQLN